MPDSTNANRGWYRYTDNKGGHWSMKVQKAWGDSGDSGFAAYNVADPVFPMTVGRNRPRAIICQHAASLRTTKVRVGSATATAWTTAYTFVSSAKGIAGAVNYDKIGEQEEHIIRAHTINSLAEPAGV